MKPTRSAVAADRHFAGFLLVTRDNLRAAQSQAFLTE